MVIGGNARDVYGGKIEAIRLRTLKDGEVLSFKSRCAYTRLRLMI